MVRAAIADLKTTHQPDFFIINGENAAGGNGITPRLCYELMRAGADVITLGDHAWDQREILDFIDSEPRLIRPLNFPQGTPGKGSIVVSSNGKKLAVINLLGRAFINAAVDNPFLLIGPELERLRAETPCIFIDFHAEATSEKIAFGHAVDGQVTAVVGTHTHVQTADEKILSGGTAYLTDAGFCGPHHSVIGRDIASILHRYRTLLPQRAHVATGGLQADGVFIECDDASGRALKIERLQWKLPGS